jgi:hypothetical protein
LTAFLFADDKVALSASEGSHQKFLGQLFNLASKYDLTVSTSKTDILAIK